MSHKATNWAVEQRGIPPIAKVVLWHLADRHHPDNGCFPDQDTLAKCVEVSRASINRHLNELEHAGLIRREPRIDKRTGRQLSTRYRLAFEEGFEPLDMASHVAGADTDIRVSEIDISVSQDRAIPCVTAETPIEPVIRTSNKIQEKNAHERLRGAQDLPVVDGKVRLHVDDPLFRKIVELKGNRHPPTDRDGCWTFPTDIVTRARLELSKPQPDEAVH